MKRATFALVLLLAVAEAAQAFRTPAVRSRNGAADEPPATVRMPEDAEPDPRRPHITIEGRPVPAITVSPAPKTEAPVAAPKPPAPQPEPIAAPEPEPEAPKPAPVASPKPQTDMPKPAPPAVPQPAQAAPSAAAMPSEKPPVAVVPVAPRAPLPVLATPLPAPTALKPEPAVLPEPAPVAAPRPEPARATPPTPASVSRAPQTPALPAKPPAAAAGKPDPRLIEAIFACLSPGLPNEWKKAWIVLSEAGSGRGLDAKFYYSVKPTDEQGEPLVPCNARELADRVLGLNELLPPDKRQWRQARLLITSDGAYELKYDYPQ